MKLKYNFVVNQIADQMVAVAVGEDLEKFNGFLKMNDIGAFILEQLKNDVTIDDIVEAMKNEYEGESEDEMRETATEFVNKLVEAKIVE